MRCGRNSMIKTHGLYILSDDYFERYGQSEMMSNKYENCPYYLAIEGANGIIWLVPLSSKVEKYRLSIAADEKKYGKGKCIFHYIARVKGKDSAFLIGDAIPVIEKYLLRPFTVNGSPFVVEDEKDIKAIQSKLSRYLALVRNGRLKPYADILDIEKSLLKELTLF